MTPVSNVSAKSNAKPNVLTKMVQGQTWSTFSVNDYVFELRREKVKTTNFEESLFNFFVMYILFVTCAQQTIAGIPNGTVTLVGAWSVCTDCLLVTVVVVSFTLIKI